MQCNMDPGSPCWLKYKPRGGLIGPLVSSSLDQGQLSFLPLSALFYAIGCTTPFRLLSPPYLFNSPLKMLPNAVGNGAMFTNPSHNQQ